jgi:TRAP-type uncharacterized transport system fused permease subunit
MFVYGPSLLMIGAWYQILLAVITASIGVTALAAALHGYLLRPARLWERLALLASAIALIKPGLVTDLLGLGLVGAVVLSQRVLSVRAATAAAEPPAE